MLEEPKPVAWMHHWDGGLPSHSVSFTVTEQHFDGVKTVPLYTHPASQAATDETLTTVRGRIKRIDDLLHSCQEAHKELHELAHEFEQLTTAKPAQAMREREPFITVLASLAATISLLERIPNAKKAAPSDKMFKLMLEDYRKALEVGRAALSQDDKS